jgi:glycosyltransferase involved in cell wall biosynthesis/SAM-dependent methyltransferase
MMQACTIIARNYLPYARVLAESFVEHHPDARFSTLILDGGGDRDEPFEVLGLHEIGIEPRELHNMAMIYDLMELATAVKPWFLRSLTQQSSGAVTYFDPDTAIYRSLDDIEELARRHSIVLTPRLTKPLPDDNCLPDDMMILQAGVYNLGFVAVSPDALPFLDWWSRRLARHGFVDFEQALFADQRWADLVPVLFRHFVLIDPGCNVAYWNVHEREIRRNGGRYEVNGQPLRFFHFSGYKPEAPTVLSGHTAARPRVRLSEQADLAALCDEYGHRLFQHGYGNAAVSTYEFGRLPGGVPVDKTMRRLFRKRLLAAERKGDPPPPDPFDTASAEQFLGWLREPHRESSISRYAYAAYQQRPDLQRTFPRVPGDDERPYLRWVRKVGPTQLGLSAELLEAVERGKKGRPVNSTKSGARESTASAAARRSLGKVTIPKKPSKGVNLVGYLKAELGIGEAARKLMAGLEQAGIEFSTITFEQTSSRQEQPIRERYSNQARFDTNIICVTADRLPSLRRHVSAQFFEQRYSIGVWFWELAHFPRAFHGAFELVDEVWVATRFIRDALAKATSKPLQIVPIPLEIPPATPLARAELGIPDQFMFLFSFDYFSIFERKNPLAVVEAFTRAFADGEGPILVVKSINHEPNLKSAQRLRHAAATRSDVHLIERYVSSSVKDSLMAGCDCYVSLHRSEGLGLTMAEAMAYGKPVIATNYSGNVDFMHPGNSYLIPYTLINVPEGCDPYPAGAAWADPDVDAAAAAMRSVYDNPTRARELGQVAREDVLSRFSLDRTASFLAEQLNTETVRAARTRRTQLRKKRGTLAAASRRLAKGPTTVFRVKRGRLPGVQTARGVARRLLWPYLVEEHKLHRSLLASVRQLQDAVGSLQDETARLRCDGDSLQAALADSVTQLHSMAVSVEQLHLLAVAAQRLEAELTVTPGGADPDTLMTTDAMGRSVIGYQGQGPTPNGVYRGFEDIFRGSEDIIRERQRVYVDVVAGHAPVLDVGCGRGEFLELLAQANIEARGIDIDPAMVARCREKGLAAEEAEAGSYLETQADDSIGAIFSAEVIEHLAYADLLRFFELAAAKLSPGGVLVAETVNPHSLSAFKAFWVDPTRRAPIFPEVAVALARLHGFESARVLFPNGTGDLDADRRTEGDYAVIATRPA